MWRDATGPIPEAVDVNFTLSIMNPGSDVDVQFAGPDLDRLRAGRGRRQAAAAGSTPASTR